jgi:hypothetical protein
MSAELVKYEVEVADSTRIIDYVDLNDIETVMAKIASFQQIVHRTLKQNLDYGIIPGTGTKPTLLKPGAEKITMLLGLRSEFEAAKTIDIDNGLIHYLVTAKLYKGHLLITEGIGTANSKENKYAKQNPWSVDNTLLKMAKKRALVDAALLVGSLSDIFTQDLEDMDLDGNKPAKPEEKVATDQDGTINKVEAKKLFSIAGDNPDIVKQAMEQYGYSKSSEIQKIHYNAILNAVTLVAQMTAPKPDETNEADTDAAGATEPQTEQDAAGQAEPSEAETTQHEPEQEPTNE